MSCTRSVQMAARRPAASVHVAAQPGRAPRPGRLRLPTGAQCIFTICLAANLFVSAGASADPRSITATYSPYEEQAIHDAAVALGTRVDSSPEGKRIERIDFVRLAPVDPHDPAPRLLNIVHVTSLVSVLRRELLVREGDRWKAVLVDESARNLRALANLTLVLCIPMRAPDPEEVRLVVITKDVWSLYVDFDFQITAGGLTSLTLEPKETNLAGTQNTLLARFLLQPASYAIGADYRVPRLDGRILTLYLDGNVIVNRAGGYLEGSYGTAAIQSPQFSSMTEWSWGDSFIWNDEIFRLYDNAVVKSFTGSSGMTIPWAYRSRTATEAIEATRSFGWEKKHDFLAGFSLSEAIYRLPQYPASDAAVAAQFANTELPLGENRVGPYVQWHEYTSDFLRVTDVDTLGLQEDERLGYETYLRVYPVFRALGSSRNLLGVYGSVSYTARMGDGFARADFVSQTEAETGRISGASLQGDVAVITPNTGLGRLIFSATVLDRWRNYLNVQSYLGGDTRLRGYPTSEFVGKDLAVANLEYRSRPIQIASFQLGGVAFFDTGDAFNEFYNLRPQQGVGVGMRAVFPQIERAVLRVDVGFPINREPLPAAGVPPFSLFIAFNQAFALPSPSP